MSAPTASPNPLSAKKISEQNSQKRESGYSPNRSTHSLLHKIQHISSKTAKGYQCQPIKNLTASDYPLKTLMSSRLQTCSNSLIIFIFIHHLLPGKTSKKPPYHNIINTQYSQHPTPTGILPNQRPSQTQNNNVSILRHLYFTTTITILLG